MIEGAVRIFGALRGGLGYYARAGTKTICSARGNPKRSMLRWPTTQHRALSHSSVLASDSPTFKPASEIRNLAFVAHVDHGKTTLVDALFQSVLSPADAAKLSERAMDSGAIEQERGITILSKVTGVKVNDKDGNPITLNLLDTPGHADFGGEVERIMSMVDMVCLLVDATEGPMPQTKFVLSKALKHGLKLLVIMNKVDRDTANPSMVEDKIFELFDELGATEEQMDYVTVYASGKQGWATAALEDEPTEGMRPLVDAMITECPPPMVRCVDESKSFSMLVSMIESDKTVHMGDILFTGKITSGVVKLGDKVKVLNLKGDVVEETKVMKIMAKNGMQRVELTESQAGNIVTLSGLTKAQVSDTICHMDVTDSLPGQPVDPPTLTVRIGPNTSPLKGKDGTKILGRQIEERLVEEARSNVAVTVKKVSGSDMMEVGGRGELQLAILIETLRREGFELSVAAPQVIFREDEQGNKLEPFEEIFFEVDESLSGLVIEKMAAAEATMNDMVTLASGRTQLEFICPSRGLFGVRTEILQKSGGTAIMHSLFHGYAPVVNIRRRTRGALISMASGDATTYALEALESRGTMYIKAHDVIYNGQIIGESSKSEDVECNPTKAKALTNFRAAGKDDYVRLAVPKKLLLEDCLSQIQDDELVEVTPLNIRLRKLHLEPSERARQRRQLTDKKKGKN
eukprot:m.26940 g.26940  ORF g.26940 m.26940 type:complete len:688 (+) comp15612_c0_seq1:72-2135(+)